MKKLLISIIIVLLLVLLGVTVVNGLNIGGLSFIGIEDLQQKSSDLDSTIEEATKLASTDYQKSIAELNQTLKQLEAKKEEYNEELSVSTDTDLQSALQIEYYPIEYLWVIIGQYAKEESVTIKMVPSQSASVEGQTLYNLNFTVTGSYIRISNFIQDIEDDESLGFRIEEFKMIPDGESTDTLQATFVCKNLRLSGISSTTNTTTDVETDETTIDETDEDSSDS